MPQTNQYTVSSFPYHRDGLWLLGSYSDDQYRGAENYSSIEDQYLLPLIPGAAYTVHYVCDQQPFTSPIGIRFILNWWYDLDNYIQVSTLTADANPSGTAVPPFALLQPPYPGAFGSDLHPGDVGYIDESSTAFPYFTFAVPASPDPTLRLSVEFQENPAALTPPQPGPTLTPVPYSLDITVGGVGPANRYRPIW